MKEIIVEMLAGRQKKQQSAKNAHCSVKAAREHLHPGCDSLCGLPSQFGVDRSVVTKHISAIGSDCSNSRYYNLAKY